MKGKPVIITALVLSLSSLTFAAEEEKAVKQEKTAKEATATKEEKAASEELKTFSAKLSYSLGLEIGASLKELQKDIDFDIFLRGLKDSLEGRKPLLTQEQTAEVRKEFMTKMQAERAQKTKELGEKNQKEGEAFLAENKKKKEVVTSPSGLQYTVVKEGDGAQPKATDEVTVHYRGTLVDGTEFDSSYKRGEPATFPVTGVIPGWTEALQLMKVGGKYRLFIPSNLAYGERGSGPQIGPNSVLIFDVELLKTAKATDKPDAVPKL